MRVLVTLVLAILVINTSCWYFQDEQPMYIEHHPRQHYHRPRHQAHNHNRYIEVPAHAIINLPRHNQQVYFTKQNPHHDHRQYHSHHNQPQMMNPSLIQKYRQQHHHNMMRQLVEEQQADEEHIHHAHHHHAHHQHGHHHHAHHNHHQAHMIDPSSIEKYRQQHHHNMRRQMQEEQQPVGEIIEFFVDNSDDNNDHEVDNHHREPRSDMQRNFIEQNSQPIEPQHFHIEQSDPNIKETVILDVPHHKKVVFETDEYVMYVEKIFFNKDK